MAFALTLFATSLLVTHAGLALIIIFWEKRRFVLRERTMAFLIGDIFLAAAIFTGAMSREDERFFHPWLLTMFIPAILFGYWQIHYEVRCGHHSSAQAWSPSKLYHQFIIYPVVLSLLVGAATVAWGDWTALAAMSAMWSVWAVLNMRDKRIRKSTHIEYEWDAFWQGLVRLSPFHAIRD